jgi:hypothetical protein
MNYISVVLLHLFITFRHSPDSEKKKAGVENMPLIL